MLHIGGYVIERDRHYAREDSGFARHNCTLPAEQLTVEPEVSGAFSGPPWRVCVTVIFRDSATSATPERRDPGTRFLSAAEAKQDEPVRFLAGGASNLEKLP
jgi:hypothetical protein